MSFLHLIHLREMHWTVEFLKLLSCFRICKPKLPPLCKTITFLLPILRIGDREKGIKRSSLTLQILAAAVRRALLKDRSNGKFVGQFTRGEINLISCKAIYFARG